MSLARIGGWAFIIGVIIALIVGFLSDIIGAALVTGILVVLGVIVGFLNVTDKETKGYLLAAVSLVIVTSLGGQALGAIPTIGGYIINVFNAIMTFVIPATIIVALKAIYSIAKSA